MRSGSCNNRHKMTSLKSIHETPFCYVLSNFTKDFMCENAPVSSYIPVSCVPLQDKSVKNTAMLKKVEEREKKKMDQMRKKLHTDDESE